MMMLAPLVGSEIFAITRGGFFSHNFHETPSVANMRTIART
jgi:hypothetical protein